MAAIWVYCIQGYHKTRWSMVSKEAAISQSAIHSYRSFNQEWLFRAPADTIGRHHKKKKFHSEHATREGFMA